MVQNGTGTSPGKVVARHPRIARVKKSGIEVGSPSVKLPKG